jgi:hypothetical protein
LNPKKKEINGQKHEAEVTAMINGGFRGECTCGWHSDKDEYEDARREAYHHLRLRYHKKKTKTRSELLIEQHKEEMKHAHQG